jgi:hypothetical protein
MLLNDRANIGGLDTAIPRIVLDHPHGDTHIALTLTVAGDRLDLRLVLRPRHKFSQHCGCALVEATAVLADPDFVRRGHGALRRLGECCRGYPFGRLRQRLTLSHLLGQLGPVKKAERSRSLVLRAKLPS